LTGKLSILNKDTITTEKITRARDHVINYTALFRKFKWYRKKQQEDLVRNIKKLQLKNHCSCDSLMIIGLAASGSAGPVPQPL